MNRSPRAPTSRCRGAAPDRSHRGWPRSRGGGGRARDPCRGIGRLGRGRRTRFYRAGGPGSGAGSAAGGGGRRCSACRAVQQVFAWILVVSRCGDGCPVGVVGAGGGQAVGQIGEIQVGMIDQVLMQPVGLGGKGCGGARRDRPDTQRRAHHRVHCPSAAGATGKRVRRGGGLLQDQVGVGAADPERGHRRGAGMVGDRPGHRFGE